MANQFDPIIDQAAGKYGIDPDLLRAGIQVESGFNPAAINPKSGATGIAQFMPATAKTLGIDPKDPVQAINGMAQLYRQNLDRFGGNVDHAVMAYQAGPNPNAWGKTQNAYADKVAAVFNGIKQNGGFIPSAPAPQQSDSLIPAPTNPNMGASSASDSIIPPPQVVQPTQLSKPQLPPAQPASMVDRLTRQLGLTARYGMEGVGDTVDAIAAPVRAGLNALFPAQQTTSGLITGQAPQPRFQPGEFTQFADYLGLPKPQTATERVVGDASRMVAGAAVPIGTGAQLAKAGNGMTRAAGTFLASNPGAQAVSAGSAGAAGGATREAGGNDLLQTGASLAAGVASPLAMTGAVSAARNLATRLPGAASNAADSYINSALQGQGLTVGDIPPSVANTLRQDVQAAVRINPNLSPDAVRRLVDYRLTNATPTNATLTLDPAAITQQKNLAKLGANSKSAGAQQLAQIENSNNRQLISGLNDLGGNTQIDQYATGDALINTLKAQDNAESGNVRNLYTQARQSSGKDLELPLAGLAQDYAQVLRDFGDKVPSGVRNNFEDLGLLTGTQQKVFTIEDADKLLKVINQNQGNDQAANTALGILRNSVKNAVTEADATGGPFAPAVAAAKQRFDRIDATPALKAVVEDNATPDKFVQKFIIGTGANVNDVAALKASIGNNPLALQTVKDQITTHLKKSALSGASDEVGNFSQSAYNKALSAIGDRKLAMFFSPDEVAKLKAIGRVASYEQVQPRGSAVNNSNTTGALLGLLEKIGKSDVVGTTPIVGKPIQNLMTGFQAKRAMNVPHGLLSQPMAKAAGLLVSPSVLLGLPQNGQSDHGNQNDYYPYRGLLSP